MSGVTPFAEQRDVCSICLDEIQPSALVYKLNCNHEYHQDCLKPWLDAKHNTCPLDTGKITSINGKQLDQANEVAVAGSSDCSAINVDCGRSSDRAQTPEDWVRHSWNFLEEARALRLNQQLRIIHNPSRIIHNPSHYSLDPVERTAAKTQQVAFSMLGIGRQGF